MRWLICFLLPFVLMGGETLHIAVCASFSQPAKKIAESFTLKTGIDVQFSIGASGALLSQIRYGAPYDVFMSADMERPLALQKLDRFKNNDVFIYARGVLVLVSRRKTFRIEKWEDVLQNDQFSHLALANPDIAPYGKAAKRFLIDQKRWKMLETKLVYGESVNQAYQFFKTGNVELAFVSNAQIHLFPVMGNYWIMDSYTIDQGCIVLKKLINSDKWVKWLNSKETISQLVNMGYKDM